MEDSYKTKYLELLEEHKKLKNEYSENVIIQSMNSMKEVYEEKVDEFNSLNKKYNLLNDCYTDVKELLVKFEKMYADLEKCEDYVSKRKLLLEDNIRAVLIMLHTLKNSRRTYGDEVKNKIQFIEDILYNALY
jgi:hypothetical protein